MGSVERLTGFGLLKLILYNVNHRLRPYLSGMYQERSLDFPHRSAACRRHSAGSAFARQQIGLGVDDRISNIDPTLLRQASGKDLEILA